MGSRRHVGDIHYTLVGYLPGSYRVLPTVVRSAYNPSLLVIGTPYDLNVLVRGTASPDTYRPTPDERYHLGKALFDDGLLLEAEPHLEKLFSEWHENLEEEPYRETARMLLFANIEKGAAPAIVKYFEVIKEKYPQEFW